MNVFITGHTSGLGKAIYDLCQSYDYHTVGLSRSTGFDLTKNLENFIQNNYWNVFVNNAYSGWAQTDLLYKLFEKNKDRNCIIVNIGSVSADGNYDSVNHYAVHKAALDKACMQLQLIDSECKVVQIKLGRMDTPLVAHKHARKMNTEDIAKIIVNHVMLAPEDILIKNYTIDVMHSRRPL